MILSRSLQSQRWFFFIVDNITKIIFLPCLHMMSCFCTVYIYPYSGLPRITISSSLPNNLTCRILFILFIPYKMHASKVFRNFHKIDRGVRNFRCRHFFFRSSYCLCHDTGNCLLCQYQETASHVKTFYNLFHLENIMHLFSSHLCMEAIILRHILRKPDNTHDSLS